MNFTEFNLHADLLTGLEKAGYTTCTPVQEQVLTKGLNGVDLYVQSQTGTGKTAAYLTLMIQQLLTNPELAGKKALIMVPTRELAVQVEEEAKILLSGTKGTDNELRPASFYGGVGYERQTALLKSNVRILVGTPGRLIDLQESGKLDLHEVAFLVVDEADRMFDMGFYPDLRTLIKVLPSSENRQTMLFSATLNTYVKNLAWEYTTEAEEIDIEPEHVTIDQIDQVLLHVSSDDKTRLLLGIIKNEKPESVIVFCNTKRSCEVIAKRLKINGIEAEYIIGDLPQSKRLQVLESFKRGSLTCLVATDVAARGIDVDDLAMVVNYDLPNEAENYIHRIGRTARAGKTGKAYTFCSEQDVYNLPAIERYIGSPIPASMAYEEMFAEDTSAGMYIKTERYDDDFSDRGGRGRNNNSHSTNSRGNGRNGDSRGSYNRDSRGSHENRNGYNRNSDNRNNDKRRYDRDGQHSTSKNIPLERIDYNVDSTKRNNDKYGKNTNTARQFDNSNGVNRDRKTGNRFDNRNNSYKNSRGDKRPPYDRNRAREEFAQDLSSMSFDERMKLYKEKYCSDSAASAAANQIPKSNNANKSTKNKPLNKKGGKNSKNSKYNNGPMAKHPTAPKGTTLGAPIVDGKKMNPGGGKPKGNRKNQETKTAKTTKKGSAGMLGLIQKFFGKKK